MSNRILLFYGSYRSDRMGIRLARFLVERMRRRGEEVDLIDAKAIDLPMLDRMYKEHPKGEAHARPLPGTARCQRWGWWSSRAPLQLVRSDRRYRLKESRSARAG